MMNEMMNRHRNRKGGFTLVELVIVIAVIAILVSILIPSFSNVVGSASEKAFLATCRNDLTDQLAKAQGEYSAIPSGSVTTDILRQNDTSAQTIAYSGTSENYSVTFSYAEGAQGWGSVTEGDSYTFIDSYGGIVTVQLPVEKVCIGTAGVAGLFKAWGQMDRVVSCASGYLDELNKLTSNELKSVGAWNKIDPEAVIDSGATVLFGWKNYTTPEAIERMKAAGVTCVWLEIADASRNTEEAMIVAHMLGLDNDSRVQSYIEECNYVTGLLEDRLPSESARLRVFLAAYAMSSAENYGANGRYRSGNSTSNWGNMLVTGGGINVAADNPTRQPYYYYEDIQAINPDVLLRLLGNEDYVDMVSELNSGTELASTTYVQTMKSKLGGLSMVDNDRYIVMDYKCQGNAVGNVVGPLYVAKYLYPDAFADVDVNAVYVWLRDYFDFEYSFGNNTYGAVYGPGQTYSDGTPVTTTAKP